MLRGQGRQAALPRPQEVAMPTNNGSAVTYRCERSADGAHLHTGSEWRTVTDYPRCEGMAEGGRRRVNGRRTALCPQHAGNVVAARVKGASEAFVAARVEDREGWERNVSRLALEGLATTDDAGALMYHRLEQQARGYSEVGNGADRFDACLDAYLRFFRNSVAHTFPVMPTLDDMAREGERQTVADLVNAATSTRVTNNGTMERDALSLDYIYENVADEIGTRGSDSS